MLDEATNGTLQIEVGDQKCQRRAKQDMAVAVEVTTPAEKKGRLSHPSHPSARVCPLSSALAPHPMPVSAEANGWFAAGRGLPLVGGCLLRIGERAGVGGVGQSGAVMQMSGRVAGCWVTFSQLGLMPRIEGGLRERAEGGRGKREGRPRGRRRKGSADGAGRGMALAKCR